MLLAFSGGADVPGTLQLCFDTRGRWDQSHTVRAGDGGGGWWLKVML